MENLKERGYEVKDTGKYIALKPAYSQRYIRLKSLGDNYSEDAIKGRIIKSRNGIRDLDKPKPDYNAWLNKYKQIKLKGFKALYYRYLYLFGKIRKKETPQRVSFYMREELIKFERYQKQFHFLYENDIETSSQLNEIKYSAEERIAELTSKRMGLYRNHNAKSEIDEINKELKILRAKLRMCNNILFRLFSLKFLINPYKSLTFWKKYYIIILEFLYLNGGLTMGNNIERWYSMKEITEYLGVSRDTVLIWIEKREMPAAKIGRLWKFKISEVDAWMKSGVAAEK